MANRQSGKVVPIEPAGPPDERRALVERIAASASFEKAQRLRELLQYLACSEEGVPEQRIGVAVFGRQPGYDTSQDNLVRVHISQLRKKLAHYFESEGAAEPLLVEIPRGSYGLAFRAREAAPVQPKAHFPPPRMFWAAVACAVAFAALAGWQTWRYQRLAGQVRPPDLSPATNRLWTALFGNDHPVTIVAADANVAFLGDMVRRTFPLREYRSPSSVERRLKDTITDPHWQQVSLNLFHSYLVSNADAQVARTLERLNMLHGFPSETTQARLINTQPLMQKNVVLLGNERANPWVGLFADRMNFRFRFDDSAHKPSFLNTSPKQGEAAVYEGRWGFEGFLVIAARPNLTGRANALIVSGTDMATVEAAGEILTGGPWMARIAAQCASGYPYFEALFRSRILANSAPTFELVAVRCGK